MNPRSMITAFATVACAVLIDASAAAQSQPQPMSDQQILSRLRDDAQYVHDLATAVSRKTRDNAVRVFCNALISDHKGVMARANRVATELKISLPESKRRSIAEIDALNSPELERRFLGEISETDGELLQQVRLEQGRKHPIQIKQILNELSPALHRDRNKAMSMLRSMPKAPAA